MTSKINHQSPSTPFPVRARHDGWTVERQYAFIEALAETGIVEEACSRAFVANHRYLHRRFQNFNFCA